MIPPLAMCLAMIAVGVPVAVLAALYLRSHPITVGGDR